MGKFEITKAKGFLDIFPSGRSDLATKYFKDLDFNILEASCYDFEPSKEDFNSAVILAQYVTAIRTIEKYAKDKGLPIFTADFKGGDLGYLEDRNVILPRYFDRRVIFLNKENKKSYEGESINYEDVLMMGRINLDRMTRGLFGDFMLAIPSKNKELFDTILKNVKALKEIPREEFKKHLLGMHTDPSVDMAASILGDGAMFC